MFPTLRFKILAVVRIWYNGSKLLDALGTFGIFLPFFAVYYRTKTYKSTLSCLE